MGRRPNPLVVEFFERGTKLEDNSNRYEHTCKRCGELFPKGRVDSLTSHLLRKCPNVTQEDRQWVFHQIQQNPERRSSSKPSQPVNGLPPNIRQEDLQSEIPLPGYQHQHQQSALDTLAEVSRRHLDYSNEPGQEHSGKTISEVLSEQALIAELQEHGILSNPVTTVESTNSYLYKADISLPQPQQTPEVPLMTTGALPASPLVQAASAANEQLERAQAHQQSPNESLVDPHLHDMGRPIQTQLNGTSTISHQESEPEPMTWNSTTLTVAQQTFGSLSMSSNEPTPGFGLLQKATKNKTRGRFNDTRRKEVQEIRKRGACIRCRMLKKPCSEGTPCSTCRNVESARLWKGKCLRTRLAEEFTLWSANVFHSKAKIQVQAVVQGLEHRSLSGRLEARFFAGSDLCLSFAAKAHGDPNGIDPALQQEAGSERNDLKNIWLLDEAESSTDKLEEYANQVADTCVEEEESLFMRATVHRAQKLVRAEEAEQATKGAEEQEHHSPRSCYNLQNQLLKNVVELWVQTRLLTSSDKNLLQLRWHPTKMPRQQPESINWDAEDRDQSIKDIPESSHSYRLILAQLLAAIESRCSKLSKTVMNELERRLLRRQQVSRFATFLSAVILLNCVERMSGLYRTFDTGENITQQAPVEIWAKDTSTSQAENSSSYPTLEAAWGDMSYRITELPNFWPLDTPPSNLWPQGPHFSDLLAMLLRMRALPPKTNQTLDGTLAAIQDYALPVQVNGRPVKEQIDEQTKTAAVWLDPLRLSVGELVKKRDGQFPGREDGVEAWDMRFVAKVLLPEKMR